MEDLLARIVAAAPSPLELTDAELAKVAAYLKSMPQLPMSDIQRARRGDPDASARLRDDEALRTLLKFAIEFNRQLRTATPPAASTTDKYKWVRQTELVHATNRVLGQGSLNPGVVSKACKVGEIMTNGKIGRASMVNIESFLTWIRHKEELEEDELKQIGDALIREISLRK